MKRLLRACLDFATEGISGPGRGIFVPTERGMVAPLANEVRAKSTGTGAKRPRDVNFRQALTILLAAVNMPAMAAAPDLLSATYIPDAQFLAYCKAQTAWDTDGNGCLSPAEAAAVAIIDACDRDISSMQGLEWFTGLTELECYDNRLISLDMSQNTALTYLDCSGNRLDVLDVSKNTALTGLECYGNRLAALDMSKNTALTYLDCSGNRLAVLDVSKNTALTYLDCFGNNLTTFDVSHNSALTYLDCNSNLLTSLDISKNPKLDCFCCDNNPGDGVSKFPVKVWFDNDAVPEEFTTKSWPSAGGRSIAPVYTTQ